jgi:multidrug resistance efflux pump
LVIFSAKFTSEDSTTIYAATNAYIDELTHTTRCEAGEPLFRVNIFELERETLKLEQECVFLRLTQRRLSKEYVDNFIFKALKTGRTISARNLKSALEELDWIRFMFEGGAAARLDVVEAEERVENARILLAKAENDLIQRTIEIESLRRQLKAQKLDLADRIELNLNIATAYQFKAQWEGQITRHTYQGAFVEEGDPILTIRRESAAASLMGSNPV